MPPAGWFVDADILGLYHVLKAARRSTTDDVYSGLTDDFPVSVGMTDAEWMSLLKGRDLAISDERCQTATLRPVRRTIGYFLWRML